MRPILALWAVPRSTSTAFEWMMRQRGDFECYHEPFGEVWYQGERPLWPRLQPDSVRTLGLTYESVWQALLQSAAQRPVFIKDFPHYLEPVWSDDFFDHFRHSFLIRDPLKTLISMHAKWPDFHIAETGFAEQRKLFDYLCQRDGKPPPVIDSDDLLEQPHLMIEAWCEQVGIDFMAEALSWEPGPRTEVSWWDGGVFHENLRNSNGLKPQPRREASLAEAAAVVQRMYPLLEPHYRWLHQHRIRLCDHGLVKFDQRVVGDEQDR